MWPWFQVRLGNCGQWSLRFPHGGVRLLPALSSHKPPLSVLPGDSLWCRADRSGSRDRELRPPQQSAGRDAPSHALQRWGRVDGPRRRMRLWQRIWAKRQRICLLGWVQRPVVRLITDWENSQAGNKQFSKEPQQSLEILLCSEWNWFAINEILLESLLGEGRCCWQKSMALSCKILPDKSTAFHK